MANKEASKTSAIKKEIQGMNFNEYLDWNKQEGYNNYRKKEANVLNYYRSLFNRLLQDYKYKNDLSYLFIKEQQAWINDIKHFRCSKYTNEAKIDCKHGFKQSLKLFDFFIEKKEITIERASEIIKSAGLEIPETIKKMADKTPIMKPKIPIHKPLTAKQERFSKVKIIDRNQITTDPHTFQGREDKFAETTVGKIVSEGYDKSRDPIIVWWDKDKNKYIVISGHSRFRASEILYEKGDKTLQKMPVKAFIGTVHDAQEYATIESNRNAPEGLKPDIKAYKFSVEKGYNKEKLLGIFPPASYLALLRDLSSLNPNGQFIEYLGEASAKSFPYLERNAGWVGKLRLKYLHRLTDAHEKEIFDYFYTTNKGLKVLKDDFFELIDKKVMTFYFDKTQPLNIQNKKASQTKKSPAAQRVGELEKNIEKLNRERAHKEELIVHAKQGGEKSLVKKFEARIKQINIALTNNHEEKIKYEAQIKKVEANPMPDLFSQMNNSVQEP